MCIIQPHPVCVDFFFFYGVSLRSKFISVSACNRESLLILYLCMCKFRFSNHYYFIWLCVLWVPSFIRAVQEADLPEPGRLFAAGGFASLTGGVCRQQSDHMADSFNPWSYYCPGLLIPPKSALREDAAAQLLHVWQKVSRVWLVTRRQIVKAVGLVYCTSLNGSFVVPRCSFHGEIWSCSDWKEK